jgi:hypothetical protein
MKQILLALAIGCSSIAYSQITLTAGAAGISRNTAPGEQANAKGVLSPALSFQADYTFLKHFYAGVSVGYTQIAIREDYMVSGPFSSNIETIRVTSHLAPTALPLTAVAGYRLEHADFVVTGGINAGTLISRGGKGNQPYISGAEYDYYNPNSNGFTAGVDLGIGYQLTAHLGLGLNFRANYWKADIKILSHQPYRSAIYYFPGTFTLSYRL